MIRIYTSYALTLFSAFAVYWLFGTMSVAAAGFTWLPFSGFVASVIHFGISSWLFLHLPKAGRIIAIASAILMCMWPVTAFISTIQGFNGLVLAIFSIPVLCSVMLIYNHIRMFNDVQRPTDITRISLSIVPFGLFVWYAIYFLSLIKSGQIQIG